MELLKKPTEHRQGQMVALIDHIQKLVALRKDEKLHQWKKVGDAPDDEVHEYNPEVIEEMLALMDKLWMFDITNHGDLYLTSGGRVVLDRGYGEYFGGADIKICSLAEIGQGLQLQDFKKRLDEAVKRREGKP